MSLISRNFYLDDLFDDFITSTKGNDMKCDIYEKEGDYHIEMDIPGFDKNDISIECNNGYLTITAEKQAESNDETKNYIRRERKYGKYQRSFYLGDMESDNINAEFKDGLLKISIPKKEEIETKKVIEIK
ncbi:MAG: Hsp20/alpha crystallin family protein [Bacilli bacterium]|nr:Hsp20/alpha crystallin family protein [Bacilli bacterium]MDD4608354.1 Hsp20/alpha crystallin family protein [Bacilli bacterium]